MSFTKEQINELRTCIRDGTKPSMCDGCPRIKKTDNLYPQSFVWGRGSPDATIEYLGRDPGVDEVRDNKCFVGGAGRVQAKLCISAGLHFSTKETPKGVYITNVCKCNYSTARGNNVPPSKAEVEYCSQYRDYENTYIKPNVRIVLGNEALLAEIGNTGIEKWRGSIFKSIRDAVKCVATFHPAFLMRGKQDWAWVVVEDLGKAKRESYDPELPSITDNYELKAQEPHFRDYTNTTSIWDIETTGLDIRNDSIKIIGVQDSEDVSRRFVQVFTWMIAQDACAKFIQDPDNILIGHNLYAYDLPMIEVKTGVAAKCQVHDTIIMSNLAFSDLPNSLAFNSSLYSNRPYWKHTSKDNLEWYNAEDVANTSSVYAGLQKELKSQHMWEYFLERTVPCTTQVLAMNREGINLDYGRMLAYKAALQKKIDQLEDLVRDKIKDPYFNYSSPKQVATLLYDKLGLPVQRHPTTGRPTANSEALDALEARLDNPNPVFKAIKALRSLAKLRSTYLSIETPRHYPELGLHRTATGRMAAPLVLIVPPGIARSIYIPDNPDMELYYADFKQIEFVVYALIAGQADFLEALENGFDAHTWTASEAIFKKPYKDISKRERHTAKFVNYGLLFGRGKRSLARAHGGTETEWGSYMNAWGIRFSKIWNHRRESLALAKKDGYIPNQWGRRRYFNSGGTNVGPKVYNYPAQSNAWEVLQDTLLALPSELKNIHQDSRILFPLHDAVLVQGYKKDRERTLSCLRTIMEAPRSELENYQFRIDIGIGDNFDEASS
jgi:uracil-DNA glycosylase family 4